MHSARFLPARSIPTYSYSNGKVKYTRNCSSHSAWQRHHCSSISSQKRCTGYSTTSTTNTWCTTSMTSCCSIAKTNLYSHPFVHMSASKRKQANPLTVISSTSLVSSSTLINSKLSPTPSRQAPPPTKHSKASWDISPSVHASFHLDDLFCVTYSISCRHYQR